MTTDTPIDQFAHCPRCGAPQRPDDRRDRGGPLRCLACGFTLYFNAASAVAVIIVREDGQALFIRRAKDPGKGKLGMPGGFVDAGERAEEALAREVSEEVGLEGVTATYLGSYPNSYVY